MKHPYHDFLLDVEKPARYVGGEYGSLPPRTGLSVALAFPDTYEIGMSYLGFHILYAVLGRTPGVCVERVFAAWPDLEGELRRRDLPLVSLESARPLGRFDVVGFSLQYELSFTNVLCMLDLGRIPLRSADRGEGDPLICAGGPVAFHAEAIAPFLDFLVLGDGEEAFPAVLAAVKRLKDAGTPRGRILEALAALPGVYVPSQVPVAEDPATGLLVAPPGVRVLRAPPVDLAAHPFPASIPVADTEIVFDRYAVEIARGCNGGCRFCQGGFIYRPLRMRTRAEIIDTIRRGLHTCGFEAASLTSLSTADYPGIETLVAFLSEELAHTRTEMSLSSLRAYALPETLFEALGRIRQSTLTFAIEAGTQRLRDMINKNIRQEDIVTSVERAFARGWRRVKLYFMIGLPTETDADVLAIVDVAAAIRDVARRFGGASAAGVTASVSTFVPKAHTPFQWEPMIDDGEIRRRQRMLYDAARRRRLSIKWHDAAMSALEGLMARADRRVASAVLRAFELGCRFDGWADRLDAALWRQACEETGIDAARYRAALPVEGRLPWDHLATGVDPAFLRREHARAHEARTTRPCYAEGVCHGCGAGCDMDAAGRAAAPLGDPPPPPPPAPLVPFRISFSRRQRMRYISQLDMVRTFPRILRRAGLRVGYSQGFRPKPLVSFSPALPLGAAALRDLADVKLEDPGLSGPELVTRLSRAAPAGLEFIAVRPLRDWEKKLSRRVAATDVVLRLRDGDDRAAVEERVMRFLDTARLDVLLPVKTGGSKTVDLRAWVLDARVRDRVEEAPDIPGPFLFLRTLPEVRVLTIAEHVLGRPVRATELYRVDLVARGALGFASIR